LTMRGVPAIALTGNNKDLDKDLNACASFHSFLFCVGFVGPEMALSKNFHANVLKSEVFQDSCIALVVDEAHNISEWGTDDFCPDFAHIHQENALFGCLPSNLPTPVAPATVPLEIIEDMKDKLSMRKDTIIIAVSNEKLNVSLSVHVMQHPQDRFTDLLPLFPSKALGPLDFPQTLIYVNGHQEAERVQDFLQSDSLECILGNHFEFYHRYVTEDHKMFIERGLYDGSLRAVPPTDALGMVHYLLYICIKRVVLWNKPHTFNSLIQKIGQCVQVFTEVSKAILFMTKQQ
ncbi:hypothetical protein K435DRAFT_688816, partial [Dendrothele bispora CBS 962.96]